MTNRLAAVRRWIAANPPGITAAVFLASVALVAGQLAIVHFDAQSAWCSGAQIDFLASKQDSALRALSRIEIRAKLSSPPWDEPEHAKERAARLRALDVELVKGVDRDADQQALAIPVARVCYSISNDRSETLATNAALSALIGLLAYWAGRASKAAPRGAGHEAAPKPSNAGETDEA